ncbi:hypothetical protein ACFLYB_02460 [Chloroflexota bacterium]
MPIKTVKPLARFAQSKQFNVLIGHSLHTPESYVPMRARNRDYDSSPNQKELGWFDAFISKLYDILASIRNNITLQIINIEIGLLGTIIPAFPITKAEKDIGE